MNANNGGEGGGRGLIIAVVLIILFAISLIISSGILLASKKDEKGGGSTTQRTRGTSAAQTPAQVDQQIQRGYAAEDAPSTLNISEYLRGLFTPESVAAMGIGMGISETLERIEISYRARQAGISQVKLNTLAKAADRIPQQLGMKIAGDVGMRAGARAGVRAGTRVTARLAAAAATGPAAPAVLIAEQAFSMVSGLMDGLNLGGFKNLSTMGMLNALRDSFDKVQREELGENTIPLVYGPLDKLSQDQRDRDYYKRLADEMKKDPKKASETDRAYIERKGKQVWGQMCTSRNGVLFKHPKNGNTYCSYKQTDCVAPWPMEVGDTYYEWKNGVCQVRPSMMRKHCEKMGLGVSYDMNTGSCKLTEAYCGRYAGSASLRNGDCNIPTGQKIAEMIFGTVITRSIINIFDFENNYKGCPPGTGPPYELMATGLTPLTIQYLCGGSRCRDDEEMMLQTLGGGSRRTGGFCYPKCPPGYKSNWGPDRSSAVAGMCYKDCPRGYDGTSELCTRRAGTIPRCPDGWEQTTAGLCQKNCTDEGFKKEHLGVCYHDAVDLSKLTREMECPFGWNKAGAGLCSKYKETCTSGQINCKYTKTRCHCTKIVEQSKVISEIGTCPNGYIEKGGMCYAQSRPFQVAKSTIEVGVCEPDEVKEDGLCYARGPITLERDNRVRTGRPAYSVFPKERKTPFPSTSESDFKNSSIGKHIQKGINSVRDGNINGLADAMAGVAMTANPATLSLGISDEMDMLYDEAKS